MTLGDPLPTEPQKPETPATTADVSLRSESPGSGDSGRLTLGDPISPHDVTSSTAAAPSAGPSLGDPVSLDHLTFSGLLSNRPSTTGLKPVGPEILPVGEEVFFPSVGDPIDPLAPDTPFEIFELWKKSQPDLPLGEHVSSVAIHTLHGLVEAGKTVASLAAKAPLWIADAGVRKEIGATVAETGAEAYKQSALTGLYAQVLNAKLNRSLGNKLDGSDAAVMAAEKNFLRFLRDVDGSSRDGRQIADALFDNRKNELGNTPVNEPGVQMLAGFAADPSIAASLATQSVKLGASVLLRDVAKAEALGRIPQIGAFAAAERAAVDAATRKAATEAEVLATKSVGGTVGAELEKRLAAETAEAERTAVHFKAQVETLQEAQLARTPSSGAPQINDGLDQLLARLSRGNEAERLAETQLAANEKSLLQQGAGAAIAKSGRAVEVVGDVLSRFADKIDRSNAAFKSGNATLGEAAVAGVGNSVRTATLAAPFAIPLTAPLGVPLALPLAAPLLGRALTAGGADMIRSLGNVAKVAGTEMAARESSVPFFQRVARALPEGSVGRWTASQAQRVEFLASTGRYAFDTASGIGEGALIGGAFGALNGDPVGGATQGAIFGTAGSQYGILRRWNSPEQIRAQQLVDIEVARQRRSESQQQEFASLSPQMQLAVASMEQAHPDLHVNFVREGGRGAAGWYSYGDRVGQITLDLDHATPLLPLLAHETKHHLALNPEIAQAVETQLLGDPNLGLPGLFTAHDADGKPVVIEMPSAENPDVPQRRFKLTPEFYDLREQYLQRLRDRGLPTAEYERDDALIAHELWAEAEVNLLHRQPNGAMDVLAVGRMNALQRKVADLVSGSPLVANSAFLQGALAKLGVAFDSFSGRAANTGLFSKSVNVPELRRAVEQYHRTLEAERVVSDEAEQRDVRLYTEADILRSPALQEAFSSGHDVVRDPSTGKMRFVTESEARKRAKEFVTTLTSELDQYVGREPNVVKRTEIVDSLGRKSVAWSGRAFPEPVIAKMEQSGRFNPTQLQSLRTLSKLLSQGSGTEVQMLYQPASRRESGKVYKTRPITERIETPLSLKITADGNVVLTTVSQQKLMRNAVEAVKSGRAQLWHNDFSALWSDVQTYLANHASGKPGDMGLGIEKRDAINALFGEFSKAHRDANPLLQEMSEKRARNMGVVQARRLDRISRLHVLSTEWKPDYGKVSRNYAPAEPAFSATPREPALDTTTRYSPGAQVETPQFKKWFGESKVTDENGDPLVVYHGTLSDFTAFDKSKANAESDLGAGFYFSNHPSDTSRNYASVDGPDHANKIERLAESIQDEMAQSIPESEVQKFWESRGGGVPWDRLADPAKAQVRDELLNSREGRKLSWDAALAEAKKRLAQHGGAHVPVFLSLKKPAIIGGDSPTFLDAKVDFSADKIGGKFGKFLDGLREAANEDGVHDTDIERTVAALTEKFAYDGGATLGDVWQIAKHDEGLVYASDDRGNLIASELLRRATEAAGFDGIIDHTVSEKFSNMGLDENSTHYVAFKPTQIKSATGNRGTFSSRNPDIRFAAPDATGVPPESSAPLTTGPAASAATLLGPKPTRDDEDQR